MIKNRNVALCIVFSFITCGIYSIYWMYNLANDVKTTSGDETAPSGGMFILLTIITLNIYGIYWYYKAGARMNTALTKANAGTADANKSVLYLILSLVGLGIVNVILIQLDLNRISNTTKPAQPTPQA